MHFRWITTLLKKGDQKKGDGSIFPLLISTPGGGRGCAATRTSKADQPVSESALAAAGESSRIVS